MFDRLIILLAFVAVIGVTWGLVRLWLVWKLRRLRVESPLGALVPSGRPAVIAFSTPTCAECRTRQAPALARLTTQMGDQITVRSLSALDHPDLVEKIGILTVPATVVLDAGGAVRHLNLGYTSDARLREQLVGTQ